MHEVFDRILQLCGMNSDRAQTCARVFAENSLDGVYTHGVNRFPTFIKNIKDGYIHVNQNASLSHQFGALEQWNGNLGPGIINSLMCTDRAMEIAGQHGIGCIGLANTNHWMRGGTYGWKAAKAGYVFLCWTNTIANLPAWGAMDCRLGNNPLIIAVPYQNEAIVLDMAVSQYSNGKLELYNMQNQSLPFPGGYNQNGELTHHPGEILKSGRALPVGYWKGSGLSLLLELLAVILSGGKTTKEISEHETEFGLSQVFIAFNISKLSNYHTIAQTIDDIIQNLHQSITEDETDQILYPGERAIQTREENLQHGIPVLQRVWDTVLRLQQ